MSIIALVLNSKPYLEKTKDQQSEELSFASTRRPPHHLQSVPQHALKQFFLIARTSKHAHCSSQFKTVLVPQACW
jgi:hypothetical protein